MFNSILILIQLYLHHNAKATSHRPNGAASLCSNILFRSDDFLDTTDEVMDSAV
jgi:hypothetical protein